MKKLLAMGLWAFAASVLVLNGAVAQEKKAAKASEVVIKVITENDKVRVYEATYKPGAENHAVASSSTRVVRCLQGGQLERTYADGKKEKLDWKPGMVQVIQPTSAYTTKNVGKTTIHLYVVQLK